MATKKTAKSKEGQITKEVFEARLTALHLNIIRSLVKLPPDDEECNEYIRQQIEAYEHLACWYSRCGWDLEAFEATLTADLRSGQEK